MIEALVVGAMSTNAYIFTSGDTCLLIDPGGDADAIVDALDKIDKIPSMVVCTHGHLDHIAALGQIVNHYLARGKRPRVAVHELDAKYFGAQAYETHKKSFDSLGIMGSAYFDSLFKPVPAPDLLLKPGAVIPNTTLNVLHTPGHTRGSICLYDSGQMVLFSGDTLFQEGIGRTDLPDGDSSSILKSIADHILLLPEDTLVYPGHGGTTTIAWEKTHNPFFKGLTARMPPCF